MQYNIERRKMRVVDPDEAEIVRVCIRCYIGNENTMEDKWIMLYRTFQGEKLSLLGFGTMR